MTSLKKYVLVGDAQSPHLLKWAKALYPQTDLWVVSSRGFLPEFDQFLQSSRRFSLHKKSGIFGWLCIFIKCPILGIWIRNIDPDFINPHYLTSHGLLVSIIKCIFNLRSKIIGSAWGSDVLVAPETSCFAKHFLKFTFINCDITTSDSIFMANRMQILGAKNVHIFPFGLESIPCTNIEKELLFFSNRGLEPIYNPYRVLEFFESALLSVPNARLVVANTGSLLTGMRQWVERRGLSTCVDFVGRLDSDTQAKYYSRSKWYISVPISDALSVSIIEAMAHGCLPIVSNLPANRELISDGINGWILPDRKAINCDFLLVDEDVCLRMIKKNILWVKEHAVFNPLLENFLTKI